MVKFQGDALFDGYKLRNTPHVLIAGEKGEILDILSPEEAGEDVQRLEGILCPGFINAHCHLELSHLQQAVPTGTGLVPFLIQVMKTRGNYSAEQISEAMMQAETAMLENGIVAVGDIANTTDSVVVKLRGRLHYHTFVETMGVADEDAARRFEHSKVAMQVFRDANLAASLVPHAPYSVSPTLFWHLDRQEGDAILSIHNQESAAEDFLFKNKTGDFLHLYEALHIDSGSFHATGLSSLQSWLPLLRNPRHLLLVHNTFTSKEDIHFTETSVHEIFWCLCPNANVYIESILPDISSLTAQNVCLITGTDSLASNRQLCILEELKTIHRHFPSIATADLLGWGTLNGARALKIEKQFGSFEPGKRPGILQISGCKGGCLSPESKVIRLL